MFETQEIYDKILEDNELTDGDIQKSNKFDHIRKKKFKRY